MRLGHGHRRSVLILWAWSVVLSGLVLYPVLTDKGNAIVPFAVAGLGVGLYTLFHPGIRRVRAENEEAAEVGRVIELKPRERAEG
jgi:UDP-GlcNAc:undecaprenyl-phosphate GlcNAc-1-phosphate transferase